MNIRDIARLANVTPSTVSRVMNNYPDISEATKKHVLQIIEQYRYDPRANSHSVRGKQNTRVGLVVESVYNPIYGQMEDILSVNLHNSGFSIASFHDNFYSQDKHKKFSELKSFMKRDKICAMVYLGGNFACLSDEELSSLPCPTVFVNTVLPRRMREDTFSSVQVSHYETAHSQMQCLLEQGHREICTVISSMEDNSVYGLRVDAYRTALAEAGLDEPGRFLACDYQPAKARTLMASYLSAHPETTAVCCAADVMAVGVLRGIYDAGRIPGKDVAVISFDGMKESEFLMPSLTTFAQPVQEMTAYTDRLLLGLIGKQKTHQHITYRPAFQKRESF